VHDGATGEVERAELVQPSARPPDPVRDRVIDEGCPEQREEHEGLEALAFCEGAADQRRCDHGEHHLEEHVGLVRDGGCVVGVGREAHVVQPDPLQAADQMELVRSEREAIPPQDPLDADEAQNEKTVHDGRQHVLAANEPAIEEAEGRRHQHDERRRRQYPCGIAAIDFHIASLRFAKASLLSSFPRAS